MTFNTSIAVAMKSRYGGYNIREITIFELKKADALFDNFELELKNKKIKIKFKCPICDKYHNFSYNICDVYKREILIGGCETLGVPIILLGRVDKVKYRLEKYIEINKKAYMLI